jgi:hypothetical protein
MRPRTLVYIAGPFSPTPEQKEYLSGLTISGEGQYAEVRRALVERNIERATRLGLQVAKLGAYPVVPHANTGHPDYEDAQPYQFWIEGTAEQLRRCDAVLFTQDWQESSGARGEERIAAECGIPRFYTLSELACWLLPGLAASTGEAVPVLDTPPGPVPRNQATISTLPPLDALPEFAEESSLAEPFGALPSGALVELMCPDEEPTRPDCPKPRQEGAA